jgi:CAP12/Pycsar effector protein, TIR domain
LATAQDPTLFIGSSSEGLDVAQNLHLVLDDYCEATVWNQGVFGLSGTGIGSLLQATQSYDFAALVLTPDDLVIKRGEARSTVRDNVLFEVGLFVGAIGLERTFLVSGKGVDLALPSDLDGVTRAKYRERADGRLEPALAPVGVKIREVMSNLGVRRGAVSPAVAPPSPHEVSLSLAEESQLLEQELASLSTSAEAQGWTVKTHTDSAYRLVAPDGLRFSLTLGDARRARQDLRPYTRELNEYGLRVSRALLTPVGDLSVGPTTRATERRRSSAEDASVA